MDLVVVVFLVAPLAIVEVGRFAETNCPDFASRLMPVERVLPRTSGGGCPGLTFVPFFVVMAFALTPNLGET